MTTSELINDFKMFLREYKKAQKFQLARRVEFVKNANQPLNKFVHASAEDRFMLRLYKEGTEGYNRKKAEIIGKDRSPEVVARVNENATRYSEEMTVIQLNIDSLTFFQNAYQGDSAKATFEEFNSLFVALMIYSHVCKKSVEEVSRLLGMAIYTGSNSTNPDYNELAKYFTKEGDISLNVKSVQHFEELYREVLGGVIKHCETNSEIKKYMDYVSPQIILDYLKAKIEEVKNIKVQRKMEAIQELVELTEAEYTSQEPIQKKDKKAKLAMEYIKSHYNNKQIISLCNNFETFKQILEDTHLSENQKKVIKTAMIVEFEKTFSPSVRAVFSWGELMLYKQGVEYVREPLDDIQNEAVGFVNNSTKDIPEYPIIKELVCKIAEVCEMAEQLKVETRDESDKEYLREEASGSFKKLRSLLTSLYSKADPNDKRLCSLIDAAIENLNFQKMQEDSQNIVKSAISNFADGLLKLAKNIEDTYGN